MPLWPPVRESPGGFHENGTPPLKLRLLRCSLYKPVPPVSPVSPHQNLQFRVVIAASYWGKFKTTFQMVMVCLMLLDLSEKFAWYGVLTNIIMWIALILTVVSLVDYLMKNKNVLKEQK